MLNCKWLETLLIPYYTSDRLHICTKVHQLAHPWSTVECSQLAVWITNRSFLEASRVKAVPWRPTNSSWNLPRAAHLKDDMMGCLQCIASHSGSALRSPELRPTHRLCSACTPLTTSIPAPIQPTIAIAIYAHAQTVTNQSTSPIQLMRFWDHPQASAGTQWRQHQLALMKGSQIIQMYKSKYKIPGEWKKWQFSITSSLDNSALDKH